MSEAAARVIVVAGALMRPLWVPPEELASRLRHLSALADLGTARADLPAAEGSLPRELAHDRWLRLQMGPRAAAMEPGALSAIRRLAPFGERLDGWLVEPVHFHLAQDHLVLVAGSAHGLAPAHADQLAEAIRPLLADESFSLDVLNPTTWLLTPGDKPLHLDCASSEAAAGRNVDGYLPTGAHARRYRKLLNEVQMTWHEHGVNQCREGRGELPINSIWLSGPVTPALLAEWNATVQAGRFDVVDTLLAARLSDDRFQWLDALQALDARLAQWLTATKPPDILLCGDQDCRWLQRKGRGRSMAKGGAFSGGGLTGLIRRLGARLGARPREATAADQGRGTVTDGLAGLFTEQAART